jgi:hypothetical protein
MGRSLGEITEHPSSRSRLAFVPRSGARARIAPVRPANASAGEDVSASIRETACFLTRRGQLEEAGLVEGAQYVRPSAKTPQAAFGRASEGISGESGRSGARVRASPVRPQGKARLGRWRAGRDVITSGQEVLALRRRAEPGSPSPEWYVDATQGSRRKAATRGRPSEKPSTMMANPVILL